MNRNKINLVHTNIVLAVLLLGLLSLRAEDDNIRLPLNDAHWKPVKDYVEATPVPEYHHAPESAREAFRDLKFGVRIHWGMFSAWQPQSGDVSWPILGMSPADRQRYQELYHNFNPVEFNATEWMNLFKESGIKVFAFTTKHHEGFSMFDTHTRVKERVNWTAPGGPRLEDCDLAYSIMETPFKRDIVRELCDAAHNAGIKIDLYFSHPDWYDADFRPYVWHPVQVPSSPYLAKKSKSHPLIDPLVAPERTPAETERMMARHRQQLTELLTNYGKVDYLCLDMWLGADVWPQLRETIMLLRKLQPDVMFRARGIGNYGDYYTPEGFVPGFKENTAMPWMVIYPLASANGASQKWGYEPDASLYQNGGWIVTNLVDAVAKGGNFMVGIGPNNLGTFHPKAVAALRAAGAWLKVNGEAIYATRPREGDLWKEGDDIRFTQTKDHRFIYAISLKWPGQSLTLKSVQPKPGSQITLLGSSIPLAWQAVPQGGVTIRLPADLQAEEQQPDKWAWAFKIEAAGT